MFSLRPSIPTSMGMGVSVGCSSPCFSSIGNCCRRHFCISVSSLSVTAPSITGCSVKCEKVGTGKPGLGFFGRRGDNRDEAVIAAREVFALVSADRQRLMVAPGTSVMAIRLMDRLPIHPVVNIPTVVKLLKTTKPTAGKAVQLLENLGVLTETSGKQRDRTFAYTRYLEKLRAGTEVER